jgi:hypothetical protein
MPTQSKLTRPRDTQTQTKTRTQLFTKLKLAHINIQGLQNRMTQLKMVLNNHNLIDLLALSETWEK